MTSREIVTALLNKQLPERMGLFEHFWPETLNDVWPRQGYPAGQSPEEVFDYDIAMCGGWLNSEPFMGRWEVLEETDEWRVTRDGRGASLKYWKAKSGTPEHIGFDCVTPERWKEYREPLLALNRDRLGDLDGMRRGIAAARKREKFVVYGTMFVFELMRATIGDENFLPALLIEPDWIRDFCQVYLDCYRTHYEVLFREVGVPDGMWIYEDLGFRNGLFCSPKTLSELVFPYEKQLVSFFKDYGLPVVIHSCGDIRKGVPLIIDAGFDCLQPMEAKAGIHVSELAKTYGNRLAYMGNIDVTVLGANDRALVEKEVVGKVQAMKRLRAPYLLHSDHSIPPEVSLATYRYMLDLFRENWEY